MVKTDFLNQRVVQRMSQFIGKRHQLALCFYDANKCGDEVADDGYYSWRANCHVKDGVIPLTPMTPMPEVGKGKTEFMIYKFRTMRNDAPSDQPTHLLQDPEAYITPVGRFLRKSSLDELPQLLNILKGEMSLVGPRPALWNQSDLVAERDKYGNE